MLTKTYDQYTRNHHRKNANLYKSIADSGSFNALASGLEGFEDESIEIITEIMTGTNLPDSFLKTRSLKKGENILEACKKARENTMKAVVEEYVKYAKENNLLNPKKFTIDAVINLVDNYYDSFYIRNSQDANLEKFPETPEAKRRQIKLNALKEIKSEVGIDKINKEYKKVKKETSFAEFCVNKTTKYVHSFNNEARAYYNYYNVDIPEKIVTTSMISQKNMSAVTKEVPTYLNMLNQSYNSRSTAERFFSYFPFINPTAKAERKAINTINFMLKESCLLKLNDVQISEYKESAQNENYKNYYQQEISATERIVEPRSKENINVIEADIEIKEPDVSEKNLEMSNNKEKTNII